MSAIITIFSSKTFHRFGVVFMGKNLSFIRCTFHAALNFVIFRYEVQKSVTLVLFKIQTLNL